MAHDKLTLSLGWHIYCVEGNMGIQYETSIIFKFHKLRGFCEVCFRPACFFSSRL